MIASLFTLFAAAATAGSAPATGGLFSLLPDIYHITSRGAS